MLPDRLLSPHLSLHSPPQAQLMVGMTAPGAAAADVKSLFNFWRPCVANPGRKSSVLSLTDRQLDAMYALAGRRRGGPR